ncbi:enoyl-[acyl-carrier-protein] reductase FabK [Irregularibacter muris]|uniref:Probable nitronate monooxygenase n=1 Tax=Irregularibacter muris TaxID=1796619 RepID=A0AAE3HFL4_9FIRM|nr:enoyl-[acyl-carrier-protein] reductase FabK [Irregularibacter muris]MCR1898144.1 enoyl-[acyl-carrier-protein] reductase FabK [Irregularibacter muris]
MLANKLCRMLNISYPIIQGGMAWVATAELAVAVSEAGGLGLIGAGNAPAEIVRNEIKKAKSLTNKPFGVNVMLMSPFADEVMEVIIEEKIAVVTTGAGNPGKFISQLHAQGIKVIPVVASVALAKRMEKNNADAVIVEGTEAGGHIGELTTMTLVPQIVDSINIPVIAAGGIGDGRGVVAAMALGASGVQIGTRFICATECIAHTKYKQYVIDAKDRDAVVSGRSTGHPVRVLKNKLSKEFDKLEKQGATIEEIQALGSGKLRDAVIDGDIQNGSVMAGQISGLVTKVQPAKEIIDEIIKQSQEITQRLKIMNKSE